MGSYANGTVIRGGRRKERKAKEPAIAALEDAFCFLLFAFRFLFLFVNRVVVTGPTGRAAAAAPPDSDAPPRSAWRGPVLVGLVGLVGLGGVCA